MYHLILSDNTVYKFYNNCVLVWSKKSEGLFNIDFKKYVNRNKNSCFNKIKFGNIIFQ